MILITAVPLHSQDKGFGAGIILGEPTGLSAKLWTSNKNAIDFGLGYAWGGDRFTYKGEYNGDKRVHFHMDYLWHSQTAIQATQRFPVFYGIGFRFNSGAGYEESFGVRGVVGIAWWPRDTPLDLFIEVIPVFQLTPATGFGIDAGLGARFFFN